jgi:hypothetical protein
VAINGTSFQSKAATRSRSDEGLANNNRSLLVSRRSSTLIEDVDGELLTKEKSKSKGELPTLDQTSHTSGGGKQRPSQGTSSAELPRLIGTKSQASTASSSATRDSGISVNDLQKAEEALLTGQTSATRKNSKADHRSRNISRMISVDDLPVSGRAMPLGKRPSTNRSAISNFEISDNQPQLSSAASTTGSKQNLRNSGASHYSRSISGGSTISIIKKTNGYMTKATSEVLINKNKKSNDDVTPPRSPLVVKNANHLLLRPADNSPFTSAHHNHLCNQSNGASSNNSTPYSQISVPSSYDYEDDFTSESDSEVAILPTANGPTNR